ncbi:adenosylhomocysteinase [Reinekea blandensis]|uniref:S-adenosyl-L-homocysteine hydrolase n=1 Tax=Reinekea blandensis MED297 TaxID=314283 RepID=A4B9W4_9GAMM|nr:adenosylhomocysteinase [Reinekea blandensis]EAR11415.1 S-adenosyl-L-homocysteine hydrolase [Reinekea sp. MED297] [Reinekea blandensis MED297]
MSELSAEFQRQLSWVQRQLPRTQKVLKSLTVPDGAKVAICTHLDIKMIPVFEQLLEQGAQMFITTCDPNTVRDEVVLYLKSKGAEACAWQGMSESDWLDSLQKAVDWQPEFICEFGGELIERVAKQSVSGFKGALEGTGSGVARLKNCDLPFPVLNWDDLDAKEGLHNRHMVGLTAWQAFCQRTYLTLHEKQITLLGYGLVGQGVAAAAKAYGGHVTVVEHDPARALMARYDGWATGELNDLLAQTDVLVTATGAKGIVGLPELSALKDGAFVMNVGHGTGEIRVHELDSLSATEVLPHVFEYNLNQRSIYLLANGAMFNLTAGFGDSLNAFDVTLAIMAGGIHYLFTHVDTLSSGLQMLPDEAWKPGLVDVR